MTSTFADLGVPESICDALAARDITTPFDIQKATLVDALAGRDVLGRAPTGSGKTIAFGIPVVAGLGKAKPKRPLALVLSPTRELADQIHAELSSFSKPVRVGTVYGGVGYGKQVRILRQGVEVLVACPGRLEDLIERGDVSLADVERVVLDEADRMADMGFMPAVRRLLDATRDDRQTVLFSATLDGDVAKLTRDYQVDPVRHEIGEATPDITLADHLFWKMDSDDRMERTKVTAEAVAAEWPAIVFCRTRHGCDRLTKQLAKLGVDAVAIHGGRSQNQRTRALKAFTGSQAQALIATDVAARGIHVDGVALVVHYDPPEDHKTYVHRSGRTARAGAGGTVVSLLTPEQTRDAWDVMHKLDLKEPITAPHVQTIRELGAGNERPDIPSVETAPEPRRKGSGNGKRKGGQGANRNRNGSSNRNRNGSGNRNNNRNGGKPRNGNGAKQGAKRNHRGEGRSERDGEGRSERDGEGRSEREGQRNGSGRGNGGGNGGQHKSRNQRNRSSNRNGGGQSRNGGGGQSRNNGGARSGGRRTPSR